MTTAEHFAIIDIELPNKDRHVDFDYTVVDDKIAEKMRSVADRIHEAMRTAVIEIGRDLLAIENQIDPGRFMDWIERECEISVRTAHRAMAAAA